MLAVLTLASASTADFFDEALALAGLTRATARFDSTIIRFYSFDEFTMPSFRSIEADPYLGPRFLGFLRNDIKANIVKPNVLLMSTRRWTGEPTRRTLLADPVPGWLTEAKKPDSLRTALDRLGARAPDLSGVPEQVQQAAALVLFRVSDSYVYRDLAFRKIPDLKAAFDLLASGNDDLEATDKRLQLLRAADLKYLFAGAHDVLLGAQEAAKLAKTVNPAARFEVSISTKWGAVLLRGAGGHTTPVGEYLLIIDTGGDDTYMGGGFNYSVDNWASVLIDTTGNDRYLAAPKMADTPLAQWEGRKSARRVPAHGGALFGVAFVADLAGDDLYRADRPCQGSGVFGVGAILDTEGDDTYDAYVDSQGFGYCGVGLLSDAEGSDSYDGFNQVQGCGLTRGAGILADGKGNDRYTGNDEQIDFASPQSAEHNVTMGQGAGYGHRADFSDGHSLGGGLGVLFDGEGNDRYSCAVLGQGVGYWQGIGALFDDAGDDTYFGMWYVQGACAHYADGYLEDSAGDDKYTATMNMAQGAGHDFSIGYLLDRAGDDTYLAPNLSLGAGNANGMGIFIEYGGNDTYTSSGTTLGKANPAAAGSPREIALCLGLFFDLSGRDTYPESADWAANGKQTVNWTQKLEDPSQSRLGIFYDKE